MEQNNKDGRDNEGFEVSEKDGKKSIDSGDVTIHIDNFKKNHEEEEVKDEELIHNSRNCLAVALANFWICYNRFVSKNRRLIKNLMTVFIFVVVVVYIVFAVREFRASGPVSVDWCHGYGMAFLIVILVVWTILYYVIIEPFILPTLCTCCQSRALQAIWRKARYGFFPIVGILVAAFLIWDTASDRRRLVSVGGLLTFIACGFILSKHPTRIRWRTVLMGLTIQFSVGMLAIRWSGGRQVFKCAGNLTETFLEYSYTGAEMVYGDLLVDTEAVFAFQSLSAVFFVSMIVQVLFYLGWMQKFCMKLGWLVQVTMGTTVMESVNAVSSVFLGMTEAPLMYKPYIKDLTLSEMHAVMAGGFSTIAGTVFAAYTSFGVDPAHIITASIMTAPTALAFSKLVYPEVSQSKTDAKNVQMYKSEDKSVMDAAIQGAMVGTSMVLGIIASVIACVSVVSFFNGVLEWAGSLAGIPNFTLETILAYLLYPVVFLLGVEPSQILVISRLLGMKISINEFVAYKSLGEIKDTGVLSSRTEAIATYALCSFANPGSIGILISTLVTLCPSQRFKVISVVTRAFFASLTISFLTACVAGALMPEDGFTD